MTKRHRGCAAFLLCALFAALLSGCAGTGGRGTVFCDDDVYTHYPAIVARALPSYTVQRAANRAFIFLGQGAAAEAFDAQALPALEAGFAKHWYPQYLATAVIAVDRGMTDAEIHGWRDLPPAGAAVGLSGATASCPLLLAAIAYGLEGEEFTLRGAAALLAGLQSQKRLALNAFHTPIVICFDYQAAGMIESGRHIEIVVPEEGTLRYVKGLLSNEALSFAGDMESELRSAGFQVPGEAVDAKAHRMENYSRLNAVTRDWAPVLRRDVLRTRLIASSNQREHILFAIVFLLITVVWVAALMRRSQQRDTRRAMVAIGVLLAAWVLVRIVKYQVPDESALGRYLWYGYYFFGLCLPLAVLRIASLAGAVSDRTRIPKPLRWTAALHMLLILLVFTNDLHFLAFRMDLSNPGWSIEYSYGILYYAVTAIVLLEVVGAVILMFLKVRRGPRRFGVIFPLLFVLFAGLCGAGYAARAPFFADADLTLTLCLFTLLFLEVCARTGQIPVNVNYRGLFRGIGLHLQITDSAGKVLLASGDRDAGIGGADFLLHKKEISGGYAVWRTDITAVNRLKAEIEATNNRLAQANALLEKNVQAEGMAAQARARLALYAALEKNIAEREQRLAETLRSVPEEEPRRGAYLGALALQVCFIKRWCDLFWLTLAGDEAVSFGSLVIYLDELAEIARQAGVQCVTRCALPGQIGIGRAMLLYDFFGACLERTTTGPHAAFVSQLVSENGRTVMKLLLSCDEMKRGLPEGLTREIAAAGGRVETRDLENTVGMWLSFDEESGGGNDA